MGNFQGTNFFVINLGGGENLAAYETFTGLAKDEELDKGPCMLWVYKSLKINVPGI
jgi:hypothetical protein